MGETSRQGRSQQVDEPTSWLLPRLVRRLPSRRISKGVPDARKQGIGGVVGEGLNLYGKAQECPPAEGKVSHRIRCARMGGMLLGARPKVGCEHRELMLHL